jgi:radical SAM enzyme (TIGR01210 family)
MVNMPEFEIDDSWILSHRTKKNPVNPEIPYAFLSERERNATGIIEDVLTIFLTNRECPFKCLMCDLWKNTTDSTVPRGAIPNQIRYVLEKTSNTPVIKLYNSGNFFDIKAIPEEDYDEIAKLLHEFNTVIVESHPKLINDRCLKFRELLSGNLEIALGLETIHPDILPKLNKKMNLNEFAKSVQFLHRNNITSRTFILLQLPFLSEKEGVEWAKRSIDFAFESGVGCCVIIPTRIGNGAMDWLEQQGYFSKPTINTLDEVLNYGISLNSGRVLADLWDIKRFSTCEKCFESRYTRLNYMNLNQSYVADISCSCQSYT